MKFLACILSIYILVLTTLPCHDTNECEDNAKVQMSQNMTNNSQEVPDVDLCSPFCDCNCCASITVQSIFKIDFTFDTFFTVQYPKYISDFSSFNFTSIWQPPKLI